MLSDIFTKRHPNFFRFGDGVPQAVNVFLRQGAQIIFEDLKTEIPDSDELCNNAYDKLVRELGYGIFSGSNSEEVCIGALCESYNLWNDAHRNPEEFAAARFSLLELLFREIEQNIRGAADPKPSSGFGLFRRSKQRASDVGHNDREQIFRTAVQELNTRLREAKIPLQYRNGLFQYVSDDLTASQIHEPFWNVVKNPKWINVDIDIKEAIDRRDNNRRDAAFYALKALESTIKIISDEKGWSHGRERGASSYIDNLVSSANGRFIETWESEQLKALFRDLRNPHGHGPGSAPQPALSAHQDNWIIECSMIWIKSLVSRL
jgi:hypothetical protein